MNSVGTVLHICMTCPWDCLWMCCSIILLTVYIFFKVKNITTSPGTRTITGNFSEKYNKCCRIFILSHNQRVSNRGKGQVVFALPIVGGRGWLIYWMSCPRSRKHSYIPTPASPSPTRFHELAHTHKHPHLLIWQLAFSLVLFLCTLWARHTTEPVFLNVYEVQESIPRNEFRQPM